jgi:large subunit ribosomal protein L19
MIAGPFQRVRQFLLRTYTFYVSILIDMTKTAMKLTSVNMDERKDLGFRAGDTLRVWSKIMEKGKTRLQAFEGLVLSRKHGTTGTNAMFTVRKVSNSVGVERIFPLYSPNIDKIEIVKKARARRSKLYYVRTKATKDIRRKLKRTSPTASEPEAETEA